VSHFHDDHSFVFQVVNNKHWQNKHKNPDFLFFFQLMLSSDKAILFGEQNRGKKGNMEILH